jgi:serine protease AprX
VTILPPANDPFVITVGSVDDQGSPEKEDDAVSSFSAYGLTEDNFAKPDLVAPGRNVISLSAGPESKVCKGYPKHTVNNDYFRMSGTSMSAPAVTGAVALLLQDEPNLTPDQVKYRLKATADAGWAGYDPSKAGVGYLDIYAAVHGATIEAANSGQVASQTLWTGSDAVAWDSVAWNSVAWNSVAWNSVAWNSVAWNSVAWNSVAWNSVLWDD